MNGLAGRAHFREALCLLGKPVEIKGTFPPREHVQAVSLRLQTQMAKLRDIGYENAHFIGTVGERQAFDQANWSALPFPP